MTRQAAINRAFGEGSDARIAGEPKSINPYSPHGMLHTWWDDGWEHVDFWWGHENRKRGRPVKPLPPVQRD